MRLTPAIRAENVSLAEAPNPTPSGAEGESQKPRTAPRLDIWPLYKADVSFAYRDNDTKLHINFMCNLLIYLLIMLFKNNIDIN